MVNYVYLPCICRVYFTLYKLCYFRFCGFKIPKNDTMSNNSLNYHVKIVESLSFISFIF